MNIAHISTDGTHQIVILPEDFQLADTSEACPILVRVQLKS